MSIVDLKSKVVSMTQASSSSNNSVAKKKSTPTIIASDLRIEGVLVSTGLVEIEGNIKGTINGNSIILREEGRIEGTIIAESVSLRGTFDGIIKAKNISISSKAKVASVFSTS